jgi:tetratricopeptide (TPR) repeat protein
MSDGVAMPEVEQTPAGRRGRLVRLLRWPAAGLVAFRRRPGRCLAVAALLAVLLGAAGLVGVHLWAGHHLRAARSCVGRYHSLEAQEHLEAVLAVRPHDPEVLLLSARTARRLGAADQAVRFLDECQKVRGKDDTDLFLEQALLRVERGETDRLREFCRTLVLQDHPSAPLVLEALTRAYLHQFRYGDAAEAIARWLERRPGDVQALYFQALLLDQRLSQREAADAYRRVLECDPDFDEARARLVEQLLQLHMAAEALGHAEYLHRRRPDDPRVEVFLARCREQMGQHEEAVRLLDRVLARHPDNGQALFERGQQALRSGQTDEAERWLRQAVVREPGDYKVRYAYFLCLGRNGKAAEAAEEQRRLDQVRADMERIQEIAGRLMQQTPHSAALHCEVGLISLRAGALAEGKRWLHSALQEDPQYAPAHRALATLYEHTGEPALAAHHRRLAEAAPARTPAP